MHYLHVISDCLWGLSPVLEICVVAAMLRTRVSSRFPLFMVYLLGHSLSDSLLLVSDKMPSVSGATWWHLYLGCLSITTALRFGAIYEIFQYIFGTHTVLSRWGKPAFRYVLLVLLAIGIGAAAATRSHESDYGLSVLHLLEETTFILQAGLLASLFAFSRYFRISWKNFAFGTALGMGVYAAVNLAVAAIKSRFDLGGSVPLNVLTLGTHDICVLIWLFYLLAPEQSSRGPASGIPEHDLEGWNQELQRLLQQ